MAVSDSHVVTGPTPKLKPSINHDVKVIVVSGLAEKDKIAKIESTHAQAILPKPYTAERLLKAMHKVLGAK